MRLRRPALMRSQMPASPERQRLRWHVGNRDLSVLPLSSMSRNTLAARFRIVVESSPY